MNRVFIVEPQWNPSVETQAIARAIRLGQEQTVSVIRYYVQGSIEEVSQSQISRHDVGLHADLVLSCRTCAHSKHGN